MTTDCLDCIDGFAIVTDPLMGTCIRTCPTCVAACPCCNGAGRFPSWTRDVMEFIARYNDGGLLPILCHTCGGAVDFDVLNADTSTEPVPTEPGPDTPTVTITVHTQDRHDEYTVAITDEHDECGLCVSTGIIVVERPHVDPHHPRIEEGSAGERMSLPCPLCCPADYLDHPAIRRRDT